MQKRIVKLTRKESIVFMLEALIDYVKERGADFEILKIAFVAGIGSHRELDARIREGTAAIARIGEETHVLQSVVPLTEDEWRDHLAKNISPK